jgi:hypothetical protein
MASRRPSPVTQPDVPCSPRHHHTKHKEHLLSVISRCHTDRCDGASPWIVTTMLPVSFRVREPTMTVVKLPQRSILPITHPDGKAQSPCHTYRENRRGRACFAHCGGATHRKYGCMYGTLNLRPLGLEPSVAQPSHQLMSDGGISMPHTDRLYRHDNPAQNIW